MKTLKESLLDNIDDILDRGEDDIKTSLNIPKIRDFEKNPHYNKMQGVTWICPYILERYKRKYPDMVLPEHKGIEFDIDTTYRVVDVNMYLKTEKAFISRKQFIRGWGGQLIGAKVTVYKKIVIDLITKLANDSKLMDEFFEHAYKAFKGTTKNSLNPYKDIFSDLINK